MHGTEHAGGIATAVARLRGSARSGATRPLAWRREQLAALERMMVECEAEFAAALAADLGKPTLEAWATETAYVAGEARYARRRLGAWMRPRRVPTPAVALPGSSRLVPEPLGVVLVIGAWNYPVQGVLAPAVSALAAGNAVLIKPSELAPASSAVLARLVPRYLDSEAVRVVEGGVAETETLLRERFDHIVYTGSGRVGRIVMRAAAEHLTPVTLELGGRSPCVVLPDADVEVAARRIAWGKFMNAGQTCIAPDHVLADAATRERLVPALVRAIHAFYGERPLASPDLSRIVNRAHFDRLVRTLERLTPVHGGARDESTLRIEPTLVVDPPAGHPLVCDEIFGPILPLLTVAGLEDAIARIEGGDTPLAAYLFTHDRAAERRFVERVRAGMMCLNDTLMFTTVPELPHGGRGASGMGVFKGRAGFERLSHLKPVLRRGWWPDLALRYPPYTDTKFRWLRRLR
jgi:aldehyde dehydrogenase (NAD+)